MSDRVVQQSQTIFIGKSISESVFSLEGQRMLFGALWLGTEAEFYGCEMHPRTSRE